jgi:hypothetical protein
VKSKIRIRSTVFQTVFLLAEELRISVAEPPPFSAAPAPGVNFDAAPAAPAPAPTLLYSKAKFLKRTKV